MIFAEQKKESGYSYEVEDIFGTISIESEAQLTPDLLDDMVVLMLRQNSTAGEIKGEVKHEGGVVKYTFKKRPLWDESEDEPCENTPTSTQKLASAFTQIRHLPVSILNWLKRFAVAFREAWRKANK